ncbi:MAG: 50S ribosomal protein L23 [Thermoplasmata archaeon]|nr:50S ribosomal protein L23 [Thermoplasmata archaeon]
MNEYDIIVKPYITEKAMFMIEKENKLTFIVHRNATKKEIKWAIEKIFNVKVENINIVYTKEGKKALVKLKQGYSADEIATRMGVF